MHNDNKSSLTCTIKYTVKEVHYFHINLSNSDDLLVKHHIVTHYLSVIVIMSE